MSRVMNLHFVERNVPTKNETPLEKNFAVETDLTNDEAQSLIVAIANVKEHADWGESLSDFDIPDNWNDLGWDEKLELAVRHMADFTGRYKVIDMLTVFTSVN